MLKYGIMILSSDTTLPLCNVASTLHCICCHYLLYIVHVEFMFIFDLMQQRTYPEGAYRGYFTFDIDVILKLDTRHWDLYLMLFDVDIILLHFITSQFSSREICVICCPRVVVYSYSYKFMVMSKPMVLSFRVSSPLEIGHNITRNSLVFAWTNLFCNPLALWMKNGRYTSLYSRFREYYVFVSNAAAASSAASQFRCQRDNLWRI